MREICVIGLDGGPLEGEAREALERAALVIGGKRHLRKLGVEPERSAILEGDLSQSLGKIEQAEGPITVLASGDPGFFGIARLLGERFGRERLRVFPGRSSVSLAFARAGLFWEDAIVVSAHGRDPRPAIHVCRAYPKVAILTSPDFGPAELARELDGLGRAFFIAEMLGEHDERTFIGKAAEVANEEWRNPNVVLVLDETRAVGSKRWLSGRFESPERWALPEAEFEHRSGMITKSETRALVLSRLGPGPGDLVWDVGAGSGSVAIECARLGAAAVAVERDSESCSRIRHNGERHGVYVQVVEGEAPGALRELPDPDAVFVGGTGGGFEEIVKLSATKARRCVVLTLITLERVVPAAEILESRGLEVETTFLQASRMKGVGELHRLAAETPVFVVTGSRI